MSPWAAHFASGNILYSGVVLLTLAAICAWKPARRPSRRMRRVAILIAVPLIAASATPIPYVLYAVWAVPVVGLFLLDRNAEESHVRKSRRTAVAATLLLSLVVVAWESATLLPTSPQRRGFRTVYVVGDSVSAGMADPPDRVWPAVMGREYPVTVVNVAHEGATARSALRQAARINDAECLVIVEIGGNDLLSGVSSDQFDHDLGELLDAVAGPGRQIVLMELPLPPLCNEYGRVQRRRAREYGAILISKRVFVGVLATRGATVDGIHLSPAGHRLMAQRVWNQIAPFVAD